MKRLLKVLSLLFRIVAILLIFFIALITIINLTDYINSANIMGVKDFIVPIIGHIVAILILILELIIALSKKIKTISRILVTILVLASLTLIGLKLPVGWGPGLLNYNFLVLIAILLSKICIKQV